MRKSKYLLLLFIFFMYSFSSFGQYQFEKQFLEQSLNISSENLLEGHSAYYLYKQKGNKLYALSVYAKLNATDFKMHIYDLDKSEWIAESALYSYDLNFERITDFVYNEDKNEVFFTYGAYLILLNENKEKNKVFETKEFSLKIDFWSKDKLILYKAYPHHPLDGKRETSVQFYDLLSNTLDDIQYFPRINGIEFGNMMNKWILPLNEELFIAQAFENTIKVYDEKGELKRELKIDIPELQQEELSDIIDTEKKVFDSIELHLLAIDKELQKKYGANYIENEALMSKKKVVAEVFEKMATPYFEKAKVDSRIKRIQSQFLYMIKLLPYDEKSFILVVYNPKYNWIYSDLYWINKNTGKVERSIKKWQNSPNPKIEEYKRLEEFFTVPLTAWSSQNPVFYKNAVWVDLLHPTTSFEAGEKKKLEERFYKESRKNGHSWIMSKYTLKN